jgi:hypothetical protein
VGDRTTIVIETLVGSVQDQATMAVPGVIGAGRQEASPDPAPQVDLRGTKVRVSVRRAADDTTHMSTGSAIRCVLQH